MPKELGKLVRRRDMFVMNGLQLHVVIHARLPGLVVKPGRRHWRGFGFRSGDHELGWMCALYGYLSRDKTRELRRKLRCE
jgi:hypothetical protein